MKKGVSIGLTTAITSLLSISSVFAQQTNFQIWGETAAGSIARLFETLRLGPTSFSTILLGILLWMVLYSVLRSSGLFREGEMGGGTAIAGIVALIVTILAFMYIPDNFVEAIVLNYGAMGATILTVLPTFIIIWFTLAVTTNLLLARMIWAVYIIYYISLALYKIGSVSASNYVDQGIFSATNLIQISPYLIALIIGIFIFLFLRPFRQWFSKEIIKSKRERASVIQRKAAAYDKLRAKGLDELGSSE